VTPAPQPAEPAESAEPATAHENTIYVQVGAFGDPDNARRRIGVLRADGIATAFVVEDTGSNPVLYRVRIGPIRDVESYDLLVDELEKLGIYDPYLVTD